MRKLILILLCLNSMTAMADSCLQTDKKGSAGDSRYYDYGRCKPAAGANNSYNSVNVIGQQLMGIMARDTDPNDRGYTDAERNANLKAIKQFNADSDTRRAFVKLGSTQELNRQEYFKLDQWQYQNAAISDAQTQAIRTEIGSAINEGKLLDLYGNKGYDDPKNAATWGSTDPATRWKTCEVATQLSGAYAFGNFIKKEQMNPALGLSIAKAGYAQHCGGTAYWLGRIYEEGDSLVPGVDKRDLQEDLKQKLMDIYDLAILNGYTPAFERMAELYRLDGPARFRGKTVSFMNSDPIWNPIPRDDKMFMMKVQYNKCLEAEPTNLVCARGLRSIYSDKAKNFDYTNYNEKLAAYYDNYVKKLEELTVKAGLPVSVSN